MGYNVTNKDRLAMIELLNTTWHMDLKASVERGDEPYTKWTVQAPNPYEGLSYKIYYTTDGSSITEAINKWFIKMEEVNGVPVEREVWTSLWDAKLELAKEEE